MKLYDNTTVQFILDFYFKICNHSLLFQVQSEFLKAYEKGIHKSKWVVLGYLSIENTLVTLVGLNM